jgi:hypothetical protein
MTMRLLWNDDDKPGEIRANSQVWADDGNPLPYVLSYGPRLDEWTACFESTQIARGTLSACLAACESAEEASLVELGNIDEVDRLQARDLEPPLDLPMLSDEQLQDAAKRAGPCPCEYGDPCHERCTCVVPHSSHGCRRCCRYGNQEQRLAKAEQLIELEDEDEVDRLRAELVKVYDAIGASKVCCPRCGGNWFVPDQFWGDPRFDCPHCEAQAAKENSP